MSVAEAVEVFAILNFAVTGASHVLRPLVWVDYFTRLRGQGQAGVFLLAFLALGFGTLVAAFHPVWTGIPAVLTVFGWAQVVKATVYFLFPDHALKKLALVTPERAWMYPLWGWIFIVLAALLSWSLWRSWS